MPLVLEAPHKARLTDVNPRSEQHGPELVPAVDLRFQLDASNGVLDGFDPRLRDLLFENDPSQLPGVELLKVRFEKLVQPLKWEDESVHNDLTIDMDISGSERIVLRDGRVHKHAFAAREGGTCSIAFTCSFTHDLSEHSMGRLGTKVQHDVWIALQGGEAPAVQAD